MMQARYFLLAHAQVSDGERKPKPLRAVVCSVWEEPGCTREVSPHYTDLWVSHERDMSEGLRLVPLEAIDRKLACLHSRGSSSDDSTLRCPRGTLRWSSVLATSGAPQDGDDE